jgi:hypothetical protein
MNSWERANGGSAIRKIGEHSVAEDELRCGFEMALVHFRIANKLTGSSFGAEVRRFDVLRRQENAGRRTRTDADQGKAN